MKNAIIILFAIAASAISCSEKEQGRLWIKHYIPTYIAPGEYVLNPDYLDHGITLTIKNAKIISSPDKYPGIKGERYLEIAERNHDMNYDRPADYDWEFRDVFADNFQSVHLTSDKDWDEQHPAGAFLDDIIWVEIVTYEPYIRNGYSGDEKTYVDAVLDQINPRETSVMSYTPYSFELYFLQPPVTNTEHTLTLQLTTTDGKTHAPTITIKPRKYVPKAKDRKQ